MSISSSMQRLLRKRKIRREKPHVWDIQPAKACYIQNYKVATRSIRHAISHYILAEKGKDTDYGDISLETVRSLSKQHSSFLSPTEIRKNYPDHFVFTFVRNPLHRLYSCYKNKLVDAHQKGLPDRFGIYGITPEMSFDQFVRIIADVPDEDADRHFRSQHWFVNSNGKSIADYVGKLESLDDGWATLEDRFGLPSLPHKNKSNNKASDPMQHYSEEIHRIASERYRQDIEQFHYQDCI